MSDQNQTPYSNPFSYGVLGLAVACFALAPVLMGYVDTGKPGFIPWAIFYGGLAQVIAGLIDLRNKNILGGTVLGLYGLLWFSLGVEFLIAGSEGWAISKVIGGNVDIMLCLMSLGFTVAFATTNLATFMILVLIDFAFAGLALSKLGVLTGEWVHPALGIDVYIIGLLSAYAAIASLLNAHFGKKMLPLGPALIKLKK